MRRAFFNTGQLRDSAPRMPRRAFLGCAAALCALGLGAPAKAQSDIAVPTQVALLEPLSITKLEDMDFGIIAGLAAGTVVMSPNVSPTCTASAGLVQSSVCQPAVFGGVGITNQRVRMRRPVSRTIVLTGPGANMTITNLVFDGGTDLTFVRENINWTRFLINRADGVFIFRVGGTLNVNANQAPGVYEGTFTVRIDYQ